MLPDPDSSLEAVASPPERGTTADPVQTDAQDIRSHPSTCPRPSEGDSSCCTSSPIWSSPVSSQVENRTKTPVCPFAQREDPLIFPRVRNPHRDDLAVHAPVGDHQLEDEDAARECACGSASAEDVFFDSCQSADSSVEQDGEGCLAGGDPGDAGAPKAGLPIVDEFLASDLKYLEEDGPDVVEFFKVLIGEGRLRPGDCGVSQDSKPAWVDEEQVRLGQQFAQKYFFGLVFAEMISLFLLFSSPGSLQPLIFSGNSDTPFKAFRRYLSTVCRVRAWYGGGGGGDLWARGGEARRELEAVRRLHAAYRRRLNALGAGPRAERERRTRLPPPLWTRGAARAVSADFADATAGVACPFFSAVAERHEWINQMEMSVTQFGFVALAVTYPERFGAGGASRAELSAFVHLWRVLGHLLGVEERFNFCAGGLDAVRRRSQVLIRRFLAPALATVDASWEHMTRCVVEGVSYYVGGMTYEVALLYLCETVGVRAPRVRATLSAQQRAMHRAAAFLLRWALRLRPLRALFNWLLLLGIKRAQAASPEWLRSRQRRVYEYERTGRAHPAPLPAAATA